MYRGDYALGRTIDFKFNTRTAAGVPITLAGAPSLTAYKNNSDAQDAGDITLIVDFDGITGLHHVRIDTSVDPTFYSGGDYQIVVVAGTVNGQSVAGQVLAEFSLNNRSGATAAAVADAVWDELRADHVVSGSMGEAEGRLDVAVSTRAAAGTSVTVTAPVATTGAVTVKRGDDYSATDGRSLDFEYSGSAVITGLTPTMKVYAGTTASWTGSVVGAASPWTVRIQPTAAQTGAVAAGTYRYDVEFTIGGRKVTLFDGSITFSVD